MNNKRLLLQSFDGGSSGRRNVSMASRSQRRDEGKGEFLARARAERQAREEERRRKLHAETIERWWRGRSCAAAFRAQLRSAWDVQMANLQQVLDTFQASGVPFAPPLASIHIFLRQLLTFHRATCAGDSHRVAKLGALLLASCKRSEPSLNYLNTATAADGAETRAWVSMTSRLLRIVLQNLRNAVVLATASPPPAALAAEEQPGRMPADLLSSCDVLCALMDVLTSPVTWREGHLDVQLWSVALHVSVAPPRPSLSRANPDCTLFEVLRACWCSPETSALAQSISQRVFQLSLNALGLSRHGTVRLPPAQLRLAVEAAFEQFAQKLLSDPTLDLQRGRKLYPDLLASLTGDAGEGWWILVAVGENIANHSLGAASLPSSSSSLSASNAMSTAARPGSLSPDVSAQAMTTLVTNLINFQGGQLSTAHIDPGRAAALVRLLVARFARLPPFAALGETGGSIGGDLPIDDDLGDDLSGDAAVNGAKGLEMLVAQQLRRGAAEARASEAAPNAVSLFAAIVHPPTIAALFDAILPAMTATIARKTSHSSASDPVVALCSIYGNVLIHGKSTSETATKILFTLALGKVPTFLPRLWRYLRELFPSVTTGMLATGAPPSLGETTSTLRATLLLFFSVYSRQLMAVNDEEFFEKQLPLALDCQFDISLMLRQHLFEMLWKSSVDHYDLEYAQLLLVTTRLFNQLYDRHARRDFAHFERDHWHWPPVHSKELSDAMGESANAAGGGGGGPGLGAVFDSRRISMVLTCIPQVLHFQQRVRIFQRLIEEDKESLNIGDGAFMGGSMVHDVTVNRSSIYEDARAALDSLGPHLKGRIRVTFDSGIDGYQEPGIDGGGLFRDFMDALTERAFDPQYGMFNVTSDELLYPNPMSAINDSHLAHFEFMGRILGKAVYSQILVKPQFAIPFLNKLLDRHNMIDDLYTLDPEMYRNLVSLKDFVRRGVDLKDLTLFFTVTRNFYGNPEQVELVPGGTDILVDNQNVSEYQIRVADFKLNKETALQSRAFLRGFHDIIPVDWIRMFDARELQMVIGGEQRAIDIENLRQFSRYGGGYHPSQEIMVWFWDILQSLTPAQQADFLKFVTSCSRQPLLGFEFLVPPLCIQKVPLDAEGHKLPTSATCMNLLKLPEYRDRETMRAKILYAISANAGFEMS